MYIAILKIGEQFFANLNKRNDYGSFLVGEYLFPEEITPLEIDEIIKKINLYRENPFLILFALQEYLPEKLAKEISLDIKKRQEKDSVSSLALFSPTFCPN